MSLSQVLGNCPSISPIAYVLSSQSNESVLSYTDCTPDIRVEAFQGSATLAI